MRWLSDGGGGGDRVGENSGGGKMGSTLEVRDSGEWERGDNDGGGVAESALGLAWFEAGGEAPGDECSGEE